MTVLKLVQQKSKFIIHRILKFQDKISWNVVWVPEIRRLFVFNYACGLFIDAVVFITHNDVKLCQFFFYFILERASRSALKKYEYMINSLIYVSTTNIYWSIQATCFDLLTSHHQATNIVSQRCCLGTGIPIFTIFTIVNNIKLFTIVNPNIYKIYNCKQYKIVYNCKYWDPITYLNSTSGSLYWWPDDDLITGRNVQPIYSSKYLL